MAVLAVLLVIAALLALILACSVRLGVRYDDTGAGLTVKIACFRLFFHPRRRKKAEEGKEGKKEEAEKARGGEGRRREEKERAGFR